MSGRRLGHLALVPGGSMPTMKHEVGEWRRWLVAAGRPETTVKLRVYQLTRFCESHPEPLACSTDALVAWLAGQGWSPETRRSWRAALIGFYRWAVATGRLDQSPAEHLPVVRVPSKSARPVPESVLADALTRATSRVRLMMDLASRVGLRRGEIARVQADDLQQVWDGWTLLVHGKGARERVVPVPADVARRIVRRARGGWLFPGADHGHLSAHRVGDLVAAALPGRWTCHSLRHRFATRAYTASGGNLLAVQRLLGHAKPETTQIYVALDVSELRAATAWAA